MLDWKLEDPYTARIDDFGSLDAVFSLQGETITKDPISEVIRVERAGTGYYIKRYRSAGKGFRRYIGRTRLRTEYRNLKRFVKWGVPTSNIVAAGLERKNGAFVRGALITEELPRTQDLAALANQSDARLSQPGWVRHVSAQIAQATRRLHDNNFTHNDLKWRNLLVDVEGQVYFIDCPTGSFWFGVFLQYRIIKDLACLDKVAKYTLSRTQRLRFYMQYAGHQQLDKRDKKNIRQILKFFEGRE